MVGKTSVTHLLSKTWMKQELKWTAKAKCFEQLFINQSGDVPNPWSFRCPNSQNWNIIQIDLQCNVEAEYLEVLELFLQGKKSHEKVPLGLIKGGSLSPRSGIHHSPWLQKNSKGRTCSVRPANLCQHLAYGRQDHLLWIDPSIAPHLGTEYSMSKSYVLKVWAHKCFFRILTWDSFVKSRIGPFQGAEKTTEVMRCQPHAPWRGPSLKPLPFFWIEPRGGWVLSHETKTFICGWFLKHKTKNILKMSFDS